MYIFDIQPYGNDGMEGIVDYIDDGVKSKNELTSEEEQEWDEVVELAELASYDVSEFIIMDEEVLYDVINDL